jgi:hypothetical protein
LRHERIFNYFIKKINISKLVIKAKEFEKFDIGNIISHVTDGIVNYDGDIGDISIKYTLTTWSDKIFHYLLEKKNSTVLYERIDKVEDLENKIFYENIQKLTWSDRGKNATLEDYKYHFEKYTLKRQKYIRKVSSLDELDQEDNRYFKYTRDIDRLSDKLFINISVNEQLERESMPGSKYYRADELSIFILYQNKNVGILRIKFLDKETSYSDQGKVVSALYTLFYSIFKQAHRIDSENKSKINLSMDENKILKDIVNYFNKIESLMIFREPKIGKVFEKYKYKYSANYYYTHTLHTHEGVDNVPRGDLVEDSLMVREQEIAGKHLHNHHDTFDNNVCYLNFVEVVLKANELAYTVIPKEIFNPLLDTINEVFFQAVEHQQRTMVKMIENKVRSEKFTGKIKSCNQSNLQIAENELNKLKGLNSKKGANRISNSEYFKKSNCLKKWISILKKNKRIDPGSNFFVKMDTNDEVCNEYIINTFLPMIPWMDWKDTLAIAKEDFKTKLDNNTKKIYRKHKDDIDMILHSIFSNKSFLYRQTEGNRAVFYESIEKQFDSYGKWEDLRRIKNKKYAIGDILKSSVKKKAYKTLKSLLGRERTD